MKLISDIVTNPSPFDIKVNVELSLIELAAIHVVFADNSTPSLKEKLRRYKSFHDFADLLKGDTSDKDVGYELYVMSKEIAHKLMGV